MLTLRYGVLIQKIKPCKKHKVDTTDALGFTHTYSNVFIKIRSSINGNESLMISIEQSLDNINNDFKINIKKVIDKWKEKLTKLKTHSSNFLNLFRQKGGSNGEDGHNLSELLISCLVNLNDEDIQKFINSFKSIVNPTECNEQSLPYFKFDLKDLLEPQNKNLQQIFESLDANENFEGDWFYKTVTDNDSLDKFIELINVLYSSDLYYLDYFQHMALFLLPDNHLYDYRDYKGSFVKIYKNPLKFRGSAILSQLTNKLDMSKLSGSLHVTIIDKSKSKSKSHATSLMFHKVGEQYVFNFFDTNGEIKFDLQKFIDFINQNLIMNLLLLNYLCKNILMTNQAIIQKVFIK